MKKAAIHICSFTEAFGDLTLREAHNLRTVLRALHKAGRFSCFEATQNQVIAKTMDAALAQKLIEVDTSPGYPWSNVKLTARGLKLAEIE